MFEMIGAGIVGAVTMFGFLKSKEFAKERASIEGSHYRPSIIGLTVGIVTTVIGAGVAVFVPVIGTGTAMIFGSSVGAGALLGSRGSRSERNLSKGGQEESRPKAPGNHMDDRAETGARHHTTI